MNRSQRTLTWWVSIALCLALVGVSVYAWLTLPACCYPQTYAPMWRIALGVLGLLGIVLTLVLLLRRRTMIAPRDADGSVGGPGSS